MDEATVQILLKAKQEGMDAIRDMKDALADLKQQAIESNLALTQIGLASMVTAAGMTALQNSVSGAGAAATAATGGGGGFTGFLGMGTGMLILVGVITALTLVFSPFIALLTAAVVILSAFAVGVAAVATSLVLAFGPLAALTAGVILLADRMFTTGKTTVDPLLQIEQALGKVADAWGKQATPMANQFLAALMPMVPMIQQIGTQALTWFGQNMPVILQIMTFVAKALFDAFELGGRIFNTFFQAMAGQKGTFESFFGALLTVGLQAVAGLLTNLLALSDWFIVRLPTMGPIVATIMGGIGSFIQGVGFVAGQVVDFFIKNWPSIANAANQAWDSIKAGWNLLAPILGPIAQQTLSELGRLFKYGADNADALKGVMFAVGVVAAALAVIVLGLSYLLIGLAGTFIDLVKGIQALATWLSNAGNAFSALGNAARAAERDIASVLLTLSKLPGAGALSQIGINLVASADAGNLGSGRYQHGGYVSGPIGSPQLAIVHGGEYVRPAGGGGALRRGGDGSGYNITFYINGATDPAAVASAVDMRLMRLMTTT